MAPSSNANDANVANVNFEDRQSIEDLRNFFEEHLGMPAEEFILQQTKADEIEKNAKEAAAKRKADPLENWTSPTRDDCPICFHPLPIDGKDSMYRSCCQKLVCKGCMSDAILCLIKDGVPKAKAFRALAKCPFCRGEPLEDSLSSLLKLAKAGRHEAMFELAFSYLLGERGASQDKREGLKWMERAAEAGYGKALYHLGDCYLQGDMVTRDIDRAIEYYQGAADGGFVRAFLDIGRIRGRNCEIEECILNYRKAALCGVSDDEVFDELRIGFSEGLITKDEYAYTLRINQKVSEEMKSESRTRATVRFSK